MWNAVPSVAETREFLHSLGRFETLAPDPKLNILTATFGRKADITIGHVNAEINGDKRPIAVVSSLSVRYKTIDEFLKLGRESVATAHPHGPTIRKTLNL